MERRQQHRFASAPVDDDLDVYIGVSTDGRGRIVAELDDLSIRGARVRVINETVVPTFVGGDLCLWLVDRPSRLEAALPAKVVHRREESGKRVFGLEFTDRSAVKRMLQPPLARLFNRRQAFRATPKSPGDVAITVLAPRELRLPLEVGTLIDLSSTGLCVDVAASFERGMAGGDLVECLLRLPRVQATQTTHGYVRHRTLRDDGSVRYGVEFTRENDAAFRIAHPLIVAYVQQRQVELLDEWGDAEPTR